MLSVKLFARMAILLALVASLFAQKVSTTTGGAVNDGNQATNAGLDDPRYVIEDEAGNLFVSDTYNHRIRKISPTGVVTTYAGTGIAGYSGDGGQARNAMLSFPNGIVFDTAGNMLVADEGNNRIRQIGPAGIIATIAGTGQAGYGGDGGLATLATLNLPWAITVDNFGALLVSDAGNQVVRKIDSAGIITTLAGNGVAGYGGDGGPATLASLDVPSGLAADGTGNVYIADRFNHRVRVVDSLGIINTIAGNGVQGFTGDGGPAIDAAIGNPRGLLLHNNVLLISNAGANRIRAVNLRTGVINSFAGSTVGFDGDGHAPLMTQFNRPTGMFSTRDGGLLVADTVNARIRRVTPATTTTVVGGWIGDGGPALEADFADPENLAFDFVGNYYVADFGGQRVRRVDSLGRITTVAGNGTSGYSGDGGPANQAQLNFPLGVAADRSGNIYIADNLNAVIRRVDPFGTISTFASDPNFLDLVSIATDAAGNLYVADDAACVIWKVTSAGSVSIAAGILSDCGFNGDGILATSALLNGDYGIAVDLQDNLYIADTLNNRLREVGSAGIISTIAGNGTCGFSGDGGPGRVAMICGPEGVAVDAQGSVYFGDYNNLRVRKVTRAGTINTVAGSGNSGYNGENLPATSTNLDGVSAVAVDRAGSVYLLDDVQNRVRKIH